eukprot:GHVR01165674.1.p2 GENE.GHVR01165674.1~~GHVR01165674.1.p2  ORF type:complete len:115 (-),score=20.98 GHVR01165674.1:739-1083(-)
MLHIYIQFVIGQQRDVAVSYIYKIRGCHSNSLAKFDAVLYTLTFSIPDRDIIKILAAGAKTYFMPAATLTAGIKIEEMAECDGKQSAHYAPTHPPPYAKSRSSKEQPHDTRQQL